ncbi:MAG: methyltransferase domain-containing protein [Chloroflexota bacterium]
MNNLERQELFDEWAKHYDRAVQDAITFPFDGYDNVLTHIIQSANPNPTMHILDVGTGTGNVAASFVKHGCRVVGIDFSTEMLEQAQAKVPQAQFLQVDLLGEWPPAIQQTFDYIVSAYVWHEFSLPTKIQLLQRFASQHLKKGGAIIIGDIAFPNAVAREQAHQQWHNQWDESEYYWAADEAIAACADVGLSMMYTQISSCGGVLHVTLAI